MKTCKVHYLIIGSILMAILTVWLGFKSVEAANTNRNGFVVSSIENNVIPTITNETSTYIDTTTNINTTTSTVTVYDNKNFYLQNISATTTVTASKDISTLAQEVMDGKWGDGIGRKNSLTNSGYDYEKVQAEVERLSSYENTPSDYPNNNNFISEENRELLAEVVHHEAGSDWIPIYEKARVVNGIMNRVYDERFPDTIYEVLSQPNQFEDFYWGYETPTESDYEVVDYYFNNIELFDECNSWYGDGVANHFYYQ